MKLVVPMKSSYNSEPKSSLATKKEPKLSNASADELTQRYMELLRLRGQVSKLEHRGAVVQPVANRLAPNLANQPGIA